MTCRIEIFSNLFLKNKDRSKIYFAILKYFFFHKMVTFGMGCYLKTVWSVCPISLTKTTKKTSKDDSDIKSYQHRLQLTFHFELYLEMVCVTLFL